jgi:hypothetical protein
MDKADSCVTCRCADLWRTLYLLREDGPYQIGGGYLQYTHVWRAEVLGDGWRASEAASVVEGNGLLCLLGWVNHKVSRSGPRP